jgi:phage-related protein
VMEAFLPLVNQATAFISEHTKAVTIVVGVIGALAAAIVATNAALKAYEAIQLIVKAATIAWTGAQIALNVALDANPIGLIVIAIGALVTALVLAYTHSQTFRNIVQAAMAAVEVAVRAVGDAFVWLYNAASSAFNWIVDHWRLAAFALGPIGALLVVIADHFDAIRNAATDAFNTIAASINAAIDAVKSLIDWLGRIHVPSIHIPSPFSLSVPAVSSTGLTRGAAGAAPRASSGGVTVNVYGAVDPEGTARAIKRVLRSSDRRLGLAW